MRGPYKSRDRASRETIGQTGPTLSPLASAKLRTGPSQKKNDVMVPTAVPRRLYSRRVGGVDNPSCQRIGFFHDAVKDAGPGQDLERCDPRCHRHGIARKRPGLIDRARRGQVPHDIAFADYGRQRKSSPDDLAQQRDIRVKPPQGLRAAEGRTKAAHYLVKNDQRHRAIGPSRRAVRGSPRPGGPHPCCPAAAPR